MAEVKCGRAHLQGARDPRPLADSAASQDPRVRLFLRAGLASQGLLAGSSRFCWGGYVASVASQRLFRAEAVAHASRLSAEVMGEWAASSDRIWKSFEGTWIF